MANLQKFTRTQLGHLTKHFERGCGSDGQPIRYSNENIDLSRSHMNYNLGPERDMSQIDFIKKRCSEVHCLNRRDVNVMCSWCVTAPKDLSPREHRAFFKATYDFLSDRYGADNVVSAYVHMDERTPHLHFAFVPVVYDRKKERYTVSAKLAVDRTDLQRFHPQLEEHLSRKLGHSVHVMTGELSDRPDLTLKQYQTMKATEDRLLQLDRRSQELTQQIREAETTLRQFEASRGALSGVYEVDKRAEKEERRAGLFQKKSTVRVMSEDDYMTLYSAATYGIAADRRCASLSDEVQRAWQVAEQNRSGTAQYQQHIAHLESEIEQYKKVIAKHPGLEQELSSRDSLQHEHARSIADDILR